MVTPTSIVVVDKQLVEPPRRSHSNGGGQRTTSPGGPGWPCRVTRVGRVPRQPYDVLDVSVWPVMGEEPAGLDEKDWLEEPGSRRAWLYKPVTRHGEVQQGENWSEKIASEVGAAMGIPCAAVELATRHDVLGCISLDLRPRRWQMQPGAVVLSGLVPDYQSQLRLRTGHSLPNIIRVLERTAVPPGSSVPEEFGAFEVFAGFLVFDALVANRDRHDENWSVLQPPVEQEPDRLAGSYDHASSLGFNLRDDERIRRLQDGTIEEWARRGTAWRFEYPPDGKPVTLTAHAADALALCRSEVRTHWLDAVSALEEDALGDIVARVPNLSAPTASFTTQRLAINRRRVLNEC